MLLQVLIEVNCGMLFGRATRRPVLVVLQILGSLGDRLLNRTTVRTRVYLLISSGRQLTVNLTVRGGYSVVDALVLEPLPAPLHRFLQFDRR